MILDVTAVEKAITAVVYEYLGSTGLKLLDFAGNIVFALLILLIGFKVCKYVEKLVKKIFDKSNMDPTLNTFLISFLKIALKVLIIIFAASQIGMTASSLVAIVGSAGLALGLSLQGSLSNIAGGVILLFLKPFQVGDYILEDSSGKEGSVQSIGIMYTKLLSIDNKTILVPNGNLSNASITNVTYQNHRRVDIDIGIEYSESVQRVREVLEGIIKKEAAYLSDQQLQIFVKDFQDSSITIGLRYWVNTEDYWESRWRVLEEIKNEFDKKGIAIPFNQLDVNIIQS